MNLPRFSVSTSGYRQVTNTEKKMYKSTNSSFGASKRTSNYEARRVPERNMNTSQVTTPREVKQSTGPIVEESVVNMTPPPSSLKLDANRSSRIEKTLHGLSFQQRDALIQRIYDKSRTLNENWDVNIWDHYITELQQGSNSN